MKCLGYMYEQGRGVAKDYSRALRLYQAAANKRHPGAYTRMGFMHHHGMGVDQNIEKALQWYKQAIELGCPAAPKKLLNLRRKESIAF